MLYNYIGFNYIIDTERKRAVAIPFQHKAAYKQKHAINAYNQWEEENVRS